MNLDYSVGIPVRNEEKSLPYTLDSILNQTIKPQEILVCVNGSTDNTEQTARKYSQKNNLIKLITSNPGKPCAWNKIANEVANDKVMFCDGDVIINKEAAEKMIETFEKDKSLILVGGSNAYTKKRETFFTKYFIEDSSEVAIKQNWVCGRLYMTRLKKLQEKAMKLNISLMPEEIINEDGFLEMITSKDRIIIPEAYNISHSVDSFRDWFIGYKRIVAGQKQLKNMYPQLFGEGDFTQKRIENYFERFVKIEGARKKIGVSTLFLIRNIVKAYYTFIGESDYKNTWQETSSTKRGFEITKTIE